MIVQEEGSDGDAHNLTFLSELDVAKTQTCSFPADGNLTISR